MLLPRRARNGTLQTLGKNGMAHSKPPGKPGKLGFVDGALTRDHILQLLPVPGQLRDCGVQLSPLLVQVTLAVPVLRVCGSGFGPRTSV